MSVYVHISHMFTSGLFHLFLSYNCLSSCSALRCLLLSGAACKIEGVCKRVGSKPAAQVRSRPSAVTNLRRRDIEPHLCAIL